MKLLLVAAVLALAAPLGADETKLGAGITLEQATPIEAVLESPEEFVGKTIRIDGVATAVCEHMGCWMAVAAADDEKGPSVRMKVEDGVIVFPVSAKGRSVSAEGVFERVGKDEHSKDAAGDHTKHDAKASKLYQIAATGAIIR